ncbi:MAG: alpha/beta fold hydrolase [Bacteroidota bacterium]
MLDVRRLIYLHGLESTSQSGKARRFAGRFPGVLTPDFTGSFAERMKQLRPILGESSGWTIIGSSYGGLMGTAFAHDHPGQVRKLVLLAPAIILPEFSARPDLKPVDVPTVLIHGRQDEVVPAEAVRILAERIFTHLDYIPVDDDHRLHKTFEAMDWEKILA